MAVAAETYIIPSPEIIESFRPTYLDADTSAHLYAARYEAKQEAAQILEQNRQLLIEGEFDSCPMPVDPLGTARRLRTVEEGFGPDSVEYNATRDGLFLDCKRLLAEAFRKNTWEYFPPAVHEFDKSKAEYFAHGHSMLDIVAGGLSPIAEPEEQDRRTNEYVEEKTYQALGRMGLKDTVSVMTISECPDWAIDAFDRNSKASHGGYVPGIKKLMIRGVHLNSDDTRQEEQVAVAGTYITHEVITEVLAETGGVDAGQSLNKTELHGKQFIDTAPAEAEGYVITFVAKLDAKATQVSGKNIFMGEEVPDDFIKDYDAIIEQAADRRSAQHRHAQELTSYIEELVANQADPWAAEALVDKFVKDILLKEARQDFKKAEDIFDKSTADGYREVSRLQALGLDNRAEMLLERVEKQAPAASYCGAGSCGLESVTAGSKEEKEVAKELGLDASKGLLKDTERACPGCNKKNIVYDMKGKKGCTNCKATKRYK